MQVNEQTSVSDMVHSATLPFLAEKRKHVIN